MIWKLQADLFEAIRDNFIGRASKVSESLSPTCKSYCKTVAFE